MTDVAAEATYVGKAYMGGVFVAPFGTTLPTDATTALDAAFDSVGYITEDGVTLGQELETEGIPAWQSAAAIRNLVTSRVVTLEFTMVEVNETVLGLYWLDPVTAAAGPPATLSQDILSDPDIPEYSVVVDVEDGAKRMRYVARRAQMTETGEQEITRTGLVGFPVTLGTLDDAGVLAHVYSNDGAA